MASSRQTFGTQLMNDINEGRIRKAAPRYVAEVQNAVTLACEELIEVGARIRPLLLNGAPVGWVRGVHLSERKHLQRWVYDDTDLVEHIIGLGTTLTKERIRTFNAVELRSLFRVIETMTASDLQLYPYLSAFVTTSTSEQLWFSQGNSLASAQQRTVELPDGAVLTISRPSDHSRLWATLCAYREKARRRVDDNLNALMIVRSWVGKGADSIAADLKNASKSLIPDIVDPWMEVVTAKKAPALEDGWGHSCDDDSLEGIQRELHGMASGDKHEQYMAALEKQMREDAVAKDKEIEERVAARGELGVVEESTVILTPEQMRARQAGLAVGVPAGVDPNVDENQRSPIDRLRKYF